MRPDQEIPSGAARNVAEIGERPLVLELDPTQVQESLPEESDREKVDPDRAFRALIGYDGADFHGWQYQPGLPTIQGEVEEAIHRITARRIRIQGAGRTDAGVHALGQVASFRLETGLEPRRLMGALNAHLPRSIRVLALEEAPDDFSARFSATHRRYRYLLARVHTPFNRSRVWVPKVWPDLASMQDSLAPLPGEHEFQAFTTQPEGPFGCRLHAASWAEWPQGYLFTIQANRFLYQMVRILVGTCLEIGKGKLGPGSMGEILQGRDRRRAGPLAPSVGLYLEEVGYDPPWPQSGRIPLDR